MKYKNKNGIGLSYEGHENDISVQLVKEVIREAIKIGDLELYQKSSRIDVGWVKVKDFLKENFSI